LVCFRRGCAFRPGNHQDRNCEDKHACE
jgi:hypothetical protein